jgi:hypothetical protein
VRSTSGLSDLSREGEGDQRGVEVGEEGGELVVKNAFHLKEPLRRLGFYWDSQRRHRHTFLKVCSLVHFLYIVNSRVLLRFRQCYIVNVLGH